MLENEVVKLVPLNDKEFTINTDLEVGKISLQDFSDHVELYVEIYPEYRQRHYASNAVYLFDDYIHKTLNINVINAVVPRSDDQLRHVVEHSGYYITSKDEDNIYYSHRLAKTVKDNGMKSIGNKKVLYFAGGCFWGVERVFKQLDGVIDTKTGYANGLIDNPSYEDVIRNETNYKECVRVIFDSDITPTDTVLKAYFLCIDPTQSNGQGEDIGSQYETGIYYVDEDVKKEVEAYLDVEKKKYEEFHVEFKNLECFYEAEEYHQDYLTKNPEGYCHITRVKLDEVRKLNGK